MMSFMAAKHSTAAGAGRVPDDGRLFHAQQQHGQQDRSDQNKFNPKHQVPLPEQREISQPTAIRFIPIASIKNPLITVGFSEWRITTEGLAD